MVMTKIVTSLYQLKESELYKPMKSQNGRSAGILVTLVLLASLSCSIKDSRLDTINQPDTVALAFKSYLNSIPSVKPLLNFMCGLNGASVAAEDFEQYKRFMPRDVQLILGHVATDQSDFVYIIYGAIGDDIYPILCSYSLDGKIIDSINLDSGCGGADETMSLTSYAEVRDDMTIVVTDTIRSFHYPENSDTYVLDGVTIDRVVYRPGNDGHFVKD